MATVLDKELATFEREKARLLREAEGKFVLIVGEDVLGVFDTQFDAIDEGWKRFPGRAILTKKITPTEEVVFIPRRVAG
jgi:hypothetical protein